MVVKRLDWSEQHRVVGEKPSLRGYELGKIVNVLEEENRIFYNLSLGIREGLQYIFFSVQAYAVGKQTCPRQFAILLCILESQ